MSLNHQQAGRDAADFDTDRHDERFRHYRSAPASGFCPINEADKIEAVSEALASVERAFGRPAPRTDWFAVAKAITTPRRAD